MYREKIYLKKKDVPGEKYFNFTILKNFLQKTVPGEQYISIDRFLQLNVPGNVIFRN